MKKILVLIIMISLFGITLSYGMGPRTQKGVIIFFDKDNIVLKTDNTKLGDICEAVETLKDIRIIVDNELMDNTISIEIKEKETANLLTNITREIPFARYIRIWQDEDRKKLEYFIIFKKHLESEEVSTDLFSKKIGLQEAFIAKHNGLKVSGKISVSGNIKLSVGSRYKLPNEIQRFSYDFIESNKSLLDLNNVTLRIKRVGNGFVDYDQYYKDVVIDNFRSNAFQIKHLEKDGVHWVLISNNTIPDVNVSVQPKITESEAVGLVINEINKTANNKKLYKMEEVIPESVELKILPQLDTKTDMIIEKFKTMSLYWSVNIDFYNYYIDAKTGKVYKAKSL